MHVQIHGARGSMPVGTAHFSRYGGDTTCYSLHEDDGSLVAVIDAGTGLRLLSPDLYRPGSTVTFLMTHYHWDHIQGLSMWAPMWSGDVSVRIIGPGDPQGLLAPAISPPWFPVSIAETQVEWVPVEESFSLGSVDVRVFPLNHPQEGVGYRFDHDGTSLVVATDHEAGTMADRAVVDTATGADLLIHDAQYLPSEIDSKKGWGHSTWEQAVEAAHRAEVERLLLASHDPARPDDEVDDIVDLARQSFTNTDAAASHSRFSLGG